ncbi:MAG: hypothetical protein J6J36_02665 [Clostridia bacterium]|nr:hypothetical protein [Clostridia bacterium]
MLPIIKVFDIDYSFIIKNYLDPKMWQKEWTLFEYKNFKISISLMYIFCGDEKISFKVKVVDGLNEEKYEKSGLFYANSDYTTVTYSLKVDNIETLKKSINSGAEYVMKSLEKRILRNTDEYQEILRVKEEEKEKLTQLAEDFLDSENVTNGDIREAYIDWYVDKMEKAYQYDDAYINSNEYQAFPDVWLIWAEASKNEYLKTLVIENVPNGYYKALMEEYEEFKEYIKTEEYEEEMADGLEDL